jgi:hypothetical protein
MAFAPVSDRYQVRHPVTRKLPDRVTGGGAPRAVGGGSEMFRADVRGVPDVLNAA